MKGRKPVPKQAKILRGTFRNYRDNKQHPTPPLIPEVPKPPAGMNKWAKGRWKILAAELVEQGLLTTLDLTALYMCCEAYGQYEEAKQAVFRPLAPKTGKRIKRTLAEYMKGRNSQTSPELAAMRAAERIYRAYLSEFGLSPSARQRLVPPKTKEAGQDPMEKLIHGA